MSLCQNTIPNGLTGIQLIVSTLPTHAGQGGITPSTD